MNCETVFKILLSPNLPDTNWRKPTPVDQWNGKSAPYLSNHKLTLFGRIGKAIAMSILYPYFGELDWREGIALCGLGRLMQLKRRGVFHNILVGQIPLFTCCHRHGQFRADDC
jgi:hypothetical protein